MMARSAGVYIALLGSANALTNGRKHQPPSFLFILGDDIGWADFRYNNGTAASLNIKAWAESAGTLVMQDFHSGGTVCSPTRATVLTGRNHFRDCVDYVYGCTDMTECVPDLEFSPSTFTVPMAVRAANKGYESWFGGKWHLGSFYNASDRLGGRLSSPISHGFDYMNATVEVAPTATTSSRCMASSASNASALTNCRHATQASVGKDFGAGRGSARTELQNSVSASMPACPAELCSLKMRESSVTALRASAFCPASWAARSAVAS